MTDNPLISVFIPYYNDEKFLKDAIDGVINQTYKNWELFLFNHDSTDNCPIIAHSYKDARIKHVNAKENLGGGSGYNLKITLPLMKGKYVKLLCADDIMKEDCLETLVDYMENHPDKDMVFADMDFISENREDLHVKWSEDIPKVNFNNDEEKTLLAFFKGYSHLAYPTAMVKKDFFDTVIPNETFVMLFDVHLWVSALIKNKKIGFINKSIIDYRISDYQSSSIKNAPKACKQGWFELYELLPIFFEIKNVNLVKKLCPCTYSKLLKENDVEFIPFIIAYFYASLTYYHRFDYFKDQIPTREIIGNQKLYELLQDENMKKKLEDKFGFGIKEFREIYSYLLPKEKENWKEHIYNKQARNLSILQCIYMLIRKIVPRIRFSKRKIQKQNTYTV